MDFLEYVKAQGILDASDPAQTEVAHKLSEAHRLFTEALDLMQVSTAQHPRDPLPASLVAQLIEELAQRTQLESQMSLQALLALEKRVRILEGRAPQ